MPARIDGGRVTSEALNARALAEALEMHSKAALMLLALVTVPCDFLQTEDLLEGGALPPWVNFHTISEVLPREQRIKRVVIT